VRDEFTTISYSNNDGTALWAGDWVEGKDKITVGGDGPGAGNIKVTGGYLFFKTEGDDPADGQNIYREADLSGGVVAATLSYTLTQNAFDGGEQVVVEVSNDGGATYDVVANLTQSTRRRPFPRRSATT
jgi:hypothetical protein